MHIAVMHPSGAILSGGVEIRGWRRSSSNLKTIDIGSSNITGLWEAPLAASLRSFNIFPRVRQLFVAGGSRRAQRPSFSLAEGSILRTATAADLRSSKGYPADDASAFRLGYVTDDLTTRSWPAGGVEVVWTGRNATHSDDPHHNCAHNIDWIDRSCQIFI